MKKRLVLLVAILVVSAPGLSAATPLFVYDSGMGTGTWSDVNKLNVYGDPDGLLCWAAAASDVLAWTGWRGWDPSTGRYLSSASDIYSRYVGTWPDDIGHPIYAYEWWMDDERQSRIGSHQPFPTPGLNFYPGVDVFKTVFGSTKIYNGLSYCILNHRGVIVTINVPFDGGAYNHFLPVWGWDLDAGKIYLTDSDDGKTGLSEYSFYQSDSKWYIDDYSNLYTDPIDAQITYVTRLDLNPGIEPNRTPEPSTVLLIGFGLLVLTAYGKKKLNKQSGREARSALDKGQRRMESRCPTSA